MELHFTDTSSDPESFDIIATHNECDSPEECGTKVGAATRKDADSWTIAYDVPDGIELPALLHEVKAETKEDAQQALREAVGAKGAKAEDRLTKRTMRGYAGHVLSGLTKLALDGGQLGPLLIELTDTMGNIIGRQPPERAENLVDVITSKLRADVKLARLRDSDQEFPGTDLTPAKVAAALQEIFGPGVTVVNMAEAMGEELTEAARQRPSAKDEPTKH